MTHLTHCQTYKKLLSIPELCDQFCETCNKSVLPEIAERDRSAPPATRTTVKPAEAA